MAKLIDKTMWFSNPMYQLVPGFLFFVLVIMFIFTALNKFDANETPPGIFRIEKVHPLDKVDVILNIQNFSEFNITEDSLTVEGNIWFIFDESKISEKDISEFDIELGDIAYKRKIYEEKNGSSKTVGYAFKCSFTSHLNYRIFPLDDHRLYLMLSNHHIKDKKLRFACRDFFINKGIKVQDWNIWDKSCSSGFITTDFSISENPIQFPGLLYSIDIKRNGFREVILILIPLLAMFFLAIVMLPFGEGDPGVIQTTSAFIVAFIAYRFTVEPLIPKVGYMTLADYMFLFFFMVSILVFYMSTFKSEMINRFRGLFMITIYVVAIIWLYWIIFYWA